MPAQTNVCTGVCVKGWGCMAWFSVILVSSGDLCQAASLCRYTLLPFKIALRRQWESRESSNFNTPQSAGPGEPWVREQCQLYTQESVEGVGARSTGTAREQTTQGRHTMRRPKKNLWSSLRQYLIVINVFELHSAIYKDRLKKRQRSISDDTWE